MTKRLGFNLARSRVNDADLLVLASRDQLGSVPVEASAVDDVGMTVDVNQNLSSSNIPNDNLVVRPGGQENIES